MDKPFIVMSPCYEILRYGHDKIKRQTEDAHVAGKLSKFIVGQADLIDPDKPPTPENFRFEARQVKDVDVVVYIDRNKLIPEVDDFIMWGRRKKRVNRIHSD